MAFLSSVLLSLVTCSHTRSYIHSMGRLHTLVTDFWAIVRLNPNQSQTAEVECKRHPDSRSWHSWTLDVCFVQLLEVLSPFGALTLSKLGLAMGGHLSHRSHLDTHSPPKPKAHSHVGRLSDISSWHTNTNCIKLLHMASNPIHSIDTLTSH